MTQVTFTDLKFDPSAVTEVSFQNVLKHETKKDSSPITGNCTVGKMYSEQKKDPVVHQKI